MRSFDKGEAAANKNCFFSKSIVDDVRKPTALCILTSLRVFREVSIGPTLSMSNIVHWIIDIE